MAARAEKYEAKNTTYNVMDTLIELNPLLWNSLLKVYQEMHHEWGNNRPPANKEEAFIQHVQNEFGVQRTTAYTYWDCISFSQSIGYRTAPIKLGTSTRYR